MMVSGGEQIRGNRLHLWAHPIRREAGAFRPADVEHQRTVTLDGLFPEQQQRIVQLVVEEISVSTSGIDIRFRSNGIEQIVEEIQPQEDAKHE